MNHISNTHTLPSSPTIKMFFSLPVRTRPDPNQPPKPEPQPSPELEQTLTQLVLHTPDWDDTPKSIAWFSNLRTTVSSLLTRLIDICEGAIQQYEQTNTHHYNRRYNRLKTSVLLLRGWLEREFLPETRMTKWFLRAVDDVLMVRATECPYDIDMLDLKARAEGVVREGHEVAGLVQEAVIRLGDKRDGAAAWKEEEMFFAMPDNGVAA